MERQQKNWSGTKELFDVLNPSCNYIVMRNFEQMDSENFLLDNHEDIDFLCDNLEKFVAVIDARPRKWYDNKVQYYILINNQKVKVDVRHLGDNYYPNEWEERMLKKRVKHEFGFYVPNQTDYFYSLIYHAILQKKKLSAEYLNRLISMGKELSFDTESEAELLNLLEEMMEREGLYFRYPLDTTVPNRFSLVKKEQVSGYFGWKIRKVRHFPIRIISFCLHLMGRL